jgi:hypothetical protein
MDGLLTNPEKVSSDVQSAPATRRAASCWVEKKGSMWVFHLTAAVHWVVYSPD